MPRRRPTVTCDHALAALLSLACLMLAPMIATTATAAPKVSVKTVYYTVHGSTPRDLLVYMLRNGPHGNHGRALGTTNANIRQSARLSPRGKGCVVQKHNLDVKMTLHLPRLAKGQKLTASDRNRWNGFAAYVKKHENHHKTLFIGCARRIDSKVRSIPQNQSCRAIAAKIKAIFADEDARCGRANQAYDRNEAKRVVKLPFMRQASTAPRFTPVRKTGVPRSTKVIRLER